MANVDQAQNELDSFLEQQFSPSNTPENTENKGDENDDELLDYLSGDDETEEGEDVSNVSPDAVTVQNTIENNEQVTHQPVQSDQERMLALERELAATKARAEMYETAIRAGYEAKTPEQQAQQQALVDYVFDSSEVEVDEQFKADYGAADPYIQAIAKRVANDMYKKAVLPLQGQLQEVKGQLERQRELNSQNQKFSIETQLRQMIPDLDQIAFSNEWASYIRNPAPFSGGTETVASLVQRGIQSGNLKQVVEIVNDFKAKHSKGQPQQQQVPPGRSQVSQPATKATGKRMLKMSDFERATADFEGGRLSWDKYQKIIDAFNTAMVEGRVNTNK